MERERTALVIVSVLGVAIMGSAALFYGGGVQVDSDDGGNVTTTVPEDTTSPYGGDHGETIGTPTVTTTEGDDPADVGASFAGFDDGDVDDGDLTVFVTVSNAGGTSADANVSVVLDRRVSDMYTERAYIETGVGPGETVNASADFEFSATGEYDLYVGGEHVDVVDVESLGGRYYTPPPGPTTTAEEPSSNVTVDSNPGAA